MGGGSILKRSDDNGNKNSSNPGVEGTRGSFDSSDAENSNDDDIASLHKQLFGVALLVASLFFDGGTGAYEDKLMSIHDVEPFDLMFKFQLSKALLSGLALLVFNQIHLFIDMVHQAGACKFASIKSLPFSWAEYWLT